MDLVARHYCEALDLKTIIQNCHPWRPLIFNSIFCALMGNVFRYQRSIQNILALDMEHGNRYFNPFSRFHYLHIFAPKKGDMTEREPSFIFPIIKH